MLRIYTKSAEHICKVRWEFVKDLKAKYVLDFGSGCGFFKAFAPPGINVDTYDIMPVPITGIRRNRYDLVTFWDVLEHISDFNEILNIFKMTKYVAITVPIKPAKMKWKDYKHYKPLEHIHHFTDESIGTLMGSLRYKLLKRGSPECPPRQYIESFLFENLSPPGENGNNGKVDPGKSSSARGYSYVHECVTGPA
jgi:hypothetical protein